MAMVFSGQDRPNKILENKINSGDTPFKGILFSDDDNFQSVLASKRYDVVVQNVRRHNHFELPLQKSLSTIAFKMSTATSDVLSMERPHRKKLEKLAVDLVCREMGIPKGVIDFDAKLVDINEIDGSQFNRTKEEILNDECKKFNQEEFSLERKKRRLINLLIQGAAKKGHYMYHLAEKELEDIVGSKDICRAYNIMMSVNDTYYWQIDDRTMEDIVHNSNAVGSSDVEFSEEYENDEDVKPKVIARAINFPVLVHELVKGVMELFSYNGHPENKEMMTEVIRLEDTLSKELWDLRLGPALWDLLREQFPTEILVEDDKVELQNYLLTDIFQLQPSELILLMEDVLSNKAQKRLAKMVNDIKIRQASQDYEETMRNFGLWDEE